MRRPFVLAILAASCLPGSAGAYEYGLQFTPNSGARGLTVAGYAFAGDTVTGNCSYYTVTGGGSGRGGGYHSHTTYYNQTCGWDLDGNLLSIAPGAPTPPTPLSTGGGLTIYARNAAGDATGVDVARGNVGFVDTLSAQYAWVTPSGGYVFLANQKPVGISLKIWSDGDVPLVVGKIEPSARLAKATVKSTTCQPAPIAVGKSCTIVVTYDPRGLPGGDNTYTAYDTLTVAIVSNTGQAPEFMESIEVPVAPAN